MSDFVRIVEMSPRDGLQNEARHVPTRDKIELIDRLSTCGFSKIEVASFVSPKWVPQMADGPGVMSGIKRAKGVSYCALTPNLRGLEAAIDANCDEVAIFVSASEGFSQNNINCSIAESLKRYAPVMARAQQAQISVRGYVSCVIDCPYDGATPPQNVAQVTAQLLQMGCFEISLGDTIGSGTPARVSSMLNAVIGEVPIAHLAGHFHDTNNNALANVAVSLDAGLRCFDGAAGGLGGCPFAPGAQGNVATEALTEFFHAQGLETGLDQDALSNAAAFAQSLRGKE